MLLIALFIVLLIPVIPALAADLSDLGRIKVVVVFQYPKNLNSLKNDYNKNLDPTITSRINTFGTAYDNFSFAKRLPNDSIVSYLIDGQQYYELYPKVVMSGTNAIKTDTEMKNDFNVLVGVIRSDIITFLQANGATNVSTHIHYTWGSVDIDEGF